MQGGNFKLESSLYGIVKLTNNTDLEKYSYSRNDIGFDAGEVFPYLTVVNLVKT